MVAVGAPPPRTPDIWISHQLRIFLHSRLLILALAGRFLETVREPAWLVTMMFSFIMLPHGFLERPCLLPPLLCLLP